MLGGPCQNLERGERPLPKSKKKLSPNDPIARSKWLFESGTFDAFGNTETPHEEREKLQAEAQLQAVKEVFNELGFGRHFQSCVQNVISSLNEDRRMLGKFRAPF